MDTSCYLCSNIVIMKEIDEYIEQFPAEVQEILRKVLEVVRVNAPEAEMGFAYGMPAFKWYGPLVYFGAYKEHIGFYPTPSGVGMEIAGLERYKHAKGTLRFPLNEEIPYDLIGEVVRNRVRENQEKHLSKKKSKG